MSFVIDHIRQIDGQLDRLQLTKQPGPASFPEDRAREPSEAVGAGDEGPSVERLLQLQAAIKTLSAASSSRGLVPSRTVLATLDGAKLLNTSSNSSRHERSGAAFEQDLEWLLVSKATTQVYGSILTLLLDQTIPFSSDIGYWDEVLGSYKYTGLYALQTSPLRLWHWTKDVYHDAVGKLQSTLDTSEQRDRQASLIPERWTHFYGLVKRSIRDRSLADMQSRFMSPLTMSQMGAKSKRRHLRRLREMSASGLGVLMDEGLMLETDEEGSVESKGRSDDKEEWKSVVSKSVSLMETVLRNVTVLELGSGDFEDTVFMSVDEEPTDSQHHTGDEESHSQVFQLALRLQQLLDVHMPAHVRASNELAAEHGRPSRLIRYWLPGMVVFLSSSTLLRIFVNRKAEIISWVRDFGATTIDFWNNWVVEPLKKVVGTIRHDKDSEIAIMSKESLQGDRASLERMVVDFATDNPNTSSGAPLTEAQIADVRTKVREGDLTPVLRAYEKDLRKPFVGTIRGDLIRALLIQVQKTKVDVEVAVGGIDNLLKSQELVFGFVGLTPGIIVCISVSRWLKGFFAGRNDRVQGRKQGSTIRVLRNIDRILSASTSANNGMLSYKEHGLLLCEVHVLRQSAQKILPGNINSEFLEEINDLVDLRTGVERQIRVVERIRWAYSKWLQ